MVTPDHTCPYGLKSKDLLERQGFKVENHPFETREQTDPFMEEHQGKTTPQTFVDGERIGGYGDLRIYFDLDKSKEEQSDTSYRPVIVIFAVSALMALGLSWYSLRTSSPCARLNGSSRSPCTFWPSKAARYREFLNDAPQL